jgi:catalase
MIIPHGERAAEALSQSGHAMEFLKDQYRHCKTILVSGAAGALLRKAGIPPALPSGKPDAGLLQFSAANLTAAISAFIEAVARHRHWQRDSDPPTV